MQGRSAGVLTVPRHVRGVVVLASRTEGSAQRDRALGRALLRAGLATLLVEDDADGDAAALAEALVAAVDWLALDAAVGDLPPILGELPVACVAAGTGAGAALVAAADRPHRVVAVVARDLPDDAPAPATVAVLPVDGDGDPEAIRGWLVAHLAGGR
jgi:hypothetical protein